MSTLTSTNPGRGYRVLGSVRISSESDIKQAVGQARKAAPLWKETPLEKRIEYVQKLSDVFKKRSREVAELQSNEVGKPITQSLDDVSGDIKNIANKIDLARDCLSPLLLDQTDGRKTMLYYEPYGVAAVITPWNFPSSNFFIATLQLLLAGNTIVFKHSEECPLTGKLLADIMQEAGFPDGVFTELYGAGAVGDLLTDQDIDLIHFTGSSKVGRYLYEKAAKKFIPVLLEMGGSSPGIVLPDADIEHLCSHMCEERFLMCGQVCCALKRLLVHESLFDDVVSLLKTQVEALVVGDPLDGKTDIGPLVAKRQLDLLIEQVQDAQGKGATVVTGGTAPSGLEGAYYLPTIMTNVSMDMRVMKEEVFGPILPIISFKTDDEAVQIANSTEYGLSAFVYGRAGDHARHIASRIDAGQVSINGASYFSKHAPFGGYKKSGMGRNDGALGFYEVTQEKVIAEPV